MLLVFGFSITPRIALHNWLATHKDTVSKTDPKDKQVHVPVFNCHCDDLVAESPFTAPAGLAPVFISPEFASCIQPAKSRLYTTPFTTLSLRGPPSVS